MGGELGEYSSSRSPGGRENVGISYFFSCGSGGGEVSSKLSEPGGNRHTRCRAHL